MGNDNLTNMASQIYNRRIVVDGVEIFYREAGERSDPSILLLHGFPTSSLMFKNLMIALSNKFHLVAPDYPGFGFSAFPENDDFEYSFDNISRCMSAFVDAIELKTYTIYLHDYGSAVGLRMCLRDPAKIDGLIVQNGNAYIEGIGPSWDETRDYWDDPSPEKKKKVAAFLSKEGVESQYTAGLPDELLPRVSPEAAVIDWDRMSRPGNVDVQFELNCTYRSHIEMFPEFQEYFRTHKPPAVVIWGKHDPFFDIAEPPCYRRDLPDAEINILNGGHMALETNFDEVVSIIRSFMSSTRGAGEESKPASVSPGGGVSRVRDQMAGDLPLPSRSNEHA